MSKKARSLELDTYLSIDPTGDTKEDLWRLIKRFMHFAMCPVDECAECDMLRVIAWELLRIKGRIE